MTRSEAITAIENGRKITHTLFTCTQYLCYKNGQMEDDNGDYIMKGEFWMIHTLKPWETGWKLY